MLTWGVTFKWLLEPEIADISEIFSGLGQMSSARKPIGRAEKYVLVLTLSALVLWAAPGLAAAISEVTPSFGSVSSLLKTYLPEYAPAVLAIIALLIIPGAGRPLPEFSELVNGVDWSTIFMFGGSFVLGLGLSNSGAGDLVANGIRSIGIRAGYFEVFAISAVLGFIVTYPASNTAAASIAIPVAIMLSRAYALNPFPAAIAAAIASSISSALPSTTPPMAMVYSSGYVRVWRMFKVGMISDIIRLVLLIMIGPQIAQSLLSMKGLLMS